MNALTHIIGALAEAWGEVKVQKARVILSLVGVVAAVAAMTTVIALGRITEQSFAELQEVYEGRATTLHISVAPSENQGTTPSQELSDTYIDTEHLNEFDIEALQQNDNPEPKHEGRTEDLQGHPIDPVGDAMATVVDRFKIPYWSRIQRDEVDIRELQEAYNTGFFRGKPIIMPEWGSSEPAQLRAVDPGYQVLFRLELLQGRWIDNNDWNQRVVPVVLNEEMWNRLGQPDINNPLVLHTNDDSNRSFRVVGVTKAKTNFAQPEMYVSYSAWKYVSLNTQNKGQSYVEMLVWVNDNQLQKARRILPQAVASVLGPNWEGNVSGGESSGIQEDQGQIFQIVIMIIGSIVIFLGALGLLNVAIVTVRQRIREIGIRRAMGASARRVFFAVFMESVVATFVAGVIGVGIAILIIRFAPTDSIGIGLQDQPGFPVDAAFIGVAISTTIGALCGVIPAVAAVRVKPIDAIRY